MLRLSPPLCLNANPTLPSPEKLAKLIVDFFPFISHLKSALLFLYGTVQYGSVSSYHDFTLSSFWQVFVNNFILFFPLRNF